ncbi:MAG: hypothetical protein JO334_19800 [Verrucomicrobia bacterium]|nr:hypothetical protein [Verrucomicrobiota bacterium]
MVSEFPFQLRPSMHGDRLVLNLSKVEEKGRALRAAEIAVVVPLMEQTLSTFNNIEGDRRARGSG